MPLLSRATTAVVGGALLLLTGCGAPAATAPTTGSSATASPPAPQQLGDCSTEYLTTVVAGQLSVGIDASARGAFFNGEEPKKAEGYEVALVEALANSLGLKRTAITWQPMTIDASTRVPREVDFLIGQLPVASGADADAGDGAVEFTEPYLVPSTVLVTRGDSALATAIAVDELRGKRLGIVKGSIDRTALDALVGADGKVAGYATADEAVAKLADDRVDGLVLDEFTAALLAAENRDLVVVATLPAVPAPGYGLAFTAGDPLVGCVNEALLMLAGEGTTAVLADEWFPGRERLTELR